MSIPHNSTTPVLILLHGAGLNGASWNPVRRHIDPRITLLTPDLPGHGARMAEPYTLAGAVDTIVAAARSVYPAPVVIGGDSLGGYASTAAASVLPPGQLKGCVLSGCSANLTGSAIARTIFIKKLVSKLSVLLMSKRMLDNALRKKFREFGTGEADIGDMLAAGMNPGIFGQAVDATRDIDFLGKVSQITQPVLFVNGANDVICMRQQAAFVAATPHARSHCFENADHGVSLLCSTQFASVVNAFSAPLLGLGTAATA